MLTRRSRAAFWAVFMVSVALALPAGALNLEVDVGYDVDGETEQADASATSDWVSAFVSYSPSPVYFRETFSQTVVEDVPGSAVLVPVSSGFASGFAREDGLMWSASNFYGGFGGDVPSPVGAASGHSGNGLPNKVSFDSEVVWSNTFVNTSGKDLPYAFNFVVDGPYLALWGPLDDSRLAGYEIDIELDGNSVWNSQAVGRHNDGDFTLAQSGTDIPLDSHGGGVWNFENYEDTVDLGVIGAGDSFTLDYTMNTYVASSGFLGSMVAQIGDPFDINAGDPMERPGVPNSVYVVPEPATITLLGLGLLGAATRRRWRSRS